MLRSKAHLDSGDADAGTSRERQNGDVNLSPLLDTPVVFSQICKAETLCGGKRVRVPEWRQVCPARTRAGILPARPPKA